MGPEGMMGGAEGVHESKKQQLSAGVHQREPEAQDRVAAQRWSSLNQLQQFQNKPASQPVMRGWERAQKCLLASRV